MFMIVGFLAADATPPTPIDVDWHSGQTIASLAVTGLALVLYVIYVWRVLRRGL